MEEEYLVPYEYNYPYSCYDYPYGLSAAYLTWPALTRPADRSPSVEVETGGSTVDLSSSDVDEESPVAVEGSISKCSSSEQTGGSCFTTRLHA